MPLGRLPFITNHSMLLGRLPQAVTSHGMPLGRLPLSITNHSLLLGRLPQAITSGSMPLGRLPLSTWKPRQDQALEMNENQSLPLGRMPLSSLPLIKYLQPMEERDRSWKKHKVCSITHRQIATRLTDILIICIC